MYESKCDGDRLADQERHHGVMARVKFMSSSRGIRLME